MTIIVKSDKYQVAVNGNEAVLRQILESDFGPKYIPSFSAAVTDDASSLLVLEVAQGDKLAFTFSYPSALLVSSPEHQVSVRDLISVIDYCLDYERQKNGLYIVHGSACAKDGKGVLFFGPVNGLGKTSLVLSLSTKKGFEFIGDEKISVWVKFCCRIRPSYNNYIPHGTHASNCATTFEHAVQNFNNRLPHCLNIDNLRAFSTFHLG